MYPQRFSSGLKNCTFKVMVSDSPPFTSTVERVKRDMEKLGVEQFIVETLAQLEQFEITYISYDNAEELSVVDSNLSVQGPMRLVQERQVDIILGAMLLLEQRAKAFSYLWGHITFSDEFKIVVKRADVVPRWKVIYLEFDSIVWVMILVTYLVFVKLVLLFFRRKQRGLVALMMMDYLFLHGSKLGGKTKARSILIVWIIFAYLISTYYQSSLTSLMAHPSTMDQVTSENDLVAFNVKPYLSRFLNQLNGEMEQSKETVENECDIQLECMKRVSESYDVYTIVLYSLYLQSS
ncbi:unnamed protein product, partial [Iphiclides podalirius]